MPAKTTSRRNILWPETWTSTLGAAAAFADVPVEESAEETLLRAGRPAMACQFEIFFPASKRKKIEAVHEALDEIQRLESQMSVYREDSEISEINREAGRAPVKVEEALFGLLSLAIDLGAETEGAFDMTAGPLSRCWGFFSRQGKVPRPGEIDRVLNHVGSRHLRLDQEQRSVSFLASELELNLGSIGKGYALDRAAGILAGAGLSSTLSHAGYSGILARGNATSGSSRPGWQLSIRHPVENDRDFALLRLCDQAMSTSGAGQQYFVAAGKKYGHIVDPRTGYPSDLNLSATALAPTAAEADALATAFFVMKLGEIEDYCGKHPNVGAVVVPQPASGGQLQCHTLGAVPDDLEIRL